MLRPSSSEEAAALRRAQSPDHLRRLRRHILFYAAAVLLAGWAFAIAYLESDLQGTLDAARGQLTALCMVLDAHTEAVFADGLGAAQAAATHLDSAGLQGIPAKQAFEMMRTELFAGEYVSSIFVATPQRTLIVGRRGYQNDAPGKPPSWLGDLFEKQPALFVGAPRPHPERPDETIVPIARKVAGQGGSVVYAGAWFGVEALHRRYAGALPAEGVVGLLTENGGILARISEGRLIESPSSGDSGDVALYRAASAVVHHQPTIISGRSPSGAQMIYAVSKPEADAALITVVGRSREAITARWTTRMLAVLVLTGMASCVLLLATWLLQRYVRELSLAQNELELANRTLEQRVSDRTRSLQEVNEELEAFTAAASHDLRSPLLAISAHAGLLAESVDDGRNVQDRLAQIQSAVRRAEGVIDGLLTLAQVSRQDLNREQVSLSQLVEQCLDELHAREPTREVETRIQRGVVVVADSRLMRSLVFNLVSNAWKYTASNTPAHIEFTCEQDEAGATFCIKDDGVGFDMAHAERLFQPFRRLHSAREFPGTGLGLTTVARIARRYGGRVWARGEPGRGAQFCFTLPLAVQSH